MLSLIPITTGTSPLNTVAIAIVCDLCRLTQPSLALGMTNAPPTYTSTASHLNSTTFAEDWHFRYNPLHKSERHTLAYTWLVLQGLDFLVRSPWPTGRDARDQGFAVGGVGTVTSIETSPYPPPKSTPRFKLRAQVQRGKLPKRIHAEDEPRTTLILCTSLGNIASSLNEYVYCLHSSPYMYGRCFCARKWAQVLPLDAVLALSWFRYSAFRPRAPSTRTGRQRRSFPAVIA